MLTIQQLNAVDLDLGLLHLKNASELLRCSPVTPIRCGLPILYMTEMESDLPQLELEHGFAQLTQRNIIPDLPPMSSFNSDYYLHYENQLPVAPIKGYPTNNQGLLQSGHNLIQAGNWEGMVAQYTGFNSQRPFIK